MNKKPALIPMTSILFENRFDGRIVQKDINAYKKSIDAANNSKNNFFSLIGMYYFAKTHVKFHLFVVDDNAPLVL